jgi:hypothetical protein
LLEGALQLGSEVLDPKQIHASYRDLGDQFKAPLRKLAARLSGSTR